MKTSNLEAWSLYAARCRRLDREASELAPLPLWVRISARWQVWALWVAVELLALAWLAGLLR